MCTVHCWATCGAGVVPLWCRQTNKHRQDSLSSYVVLLLSPLLSASYVYTVPVDIRWCCCCWLKHSRHEPSASASAKASKVPWYCWIFYACPAFTPYSCFFFSALCYRWLLCTSSSLEEVDCVSVRSSRELMVAYSRCKEASTAFLV